jgi:transposase
VKDAEWLADLMRHGLLTPSFIPPAPIRELRELTRSRKTLVEARAREVSRVQKVLEGANIKLASVATDVLGKSGRAMLEALIAGEQDPVRLSELALGRMRAKRPELHRALDGRVLGQHRILLQHLLAHIDFLERSRAEVEAEIERCLAPFGRAVALAQSLPGIAETAATALLAELGTDMTRFASAKHLSRLRRSLPGHQTKRRQALKRQDHPRQSLPASGLRRGGLGDQSYHRQLPLGPVSPDRAAAGETEGSGRGLA